jgi:ubiquinone/menaquinone biosynthesis C-methylase UbiE
MYTLEKNSIREFNKWADTYDGFFNRIYFSMSNKILANLIHLQPNQSLLDVGCGTGIFLEIFAKKIRGAKLYGVDISPEMVSVAKNKFRNYPNIKIVRGSVSKLPYEMNQFNYVVCANSLHHHPDSEKSVREMVRVLKRGGKLLILDGFTDGNFRKKFWGKENKSHREGKVYRYTKKEMENLFKTVGLININQRISMHINLITMGERI